VEAIMAESNKPSANNAPADIRNALDTIARIILSEDMKSINESIHAVENKVSRTIDDFKKEATSSIENLKKDLSNRSGDLTKSIETLKKSLDAAAADMGAKLQKANTEFSDRIVKTNDQLRNDVSAAKTNMEAKLDTYKEESERNFKSVTDQLIVHQNELKELRSQGAHFSSILGGFARIFSAPANPEAHQILAQSAPLSPPKQPIPPPPKPAVPPPQPTVQPHIQQSSQPKTPPPASVHTTSTAKTAERTISHSEDTQEQEEMALIDMPDEDIALPNSLDITNTINTMFNLGKKD
jgi:hypothetical protein